MPSTHPDKAVRSARLYKAMPMQTKLEEARQNYEKNKPQATTLQQIAEIDTKLNLKWILAEIGLVLGSIFCVFMAIHTHHENRYYRQYTEILEKAEPVKAEVLALGSGEEIEKLVSSHSCGRGCHYHQTIVRTEVADISYEVGLKTYEGTIDAFSKMWTDSNSWGYNRHAEIPNLKPGDQIDLFYLPSDPETVLMADDVLVQYLRHHYASWKLSESIQIVAAIILLLAAIIIHFWRQKTFGAASFRTWLGLKLKQFSEGGQS